MSDILLHYLPNNYYNKAYLQGFGVEAKTFHSTINLFEQFKIAEEIHKGSKGKKSKET